MATSFGLGGHHQAIAHEFKKSGTYRAKISVLLMILRLPINLKIDVKGIPY